MIKLVLSDMDGTLVPFGHDAVSDRTRAAIHRLLDAGIAFGPASGREVDELLGFFQGDGECFRTGVFANGKIVCLGGETIYERPIDSDALRRLAGFMEPLEDCFVLVALPDGRGGVYFGSLGATKDEIDRASKTLPVKLELRWLPDIPDQPIFLANAVYSPVLGDKDAAAHRLHEVVPEFDFVAPAPGWFDVLPHGWSKADAADLLLREMGLTPDQVVFFGDSDNDLTMLHRLPQTFVVSNGSPLALGAGRWHIGSAAEDAPAQVMEAIAASGGQLPPEFC